MNQFKIRASGSGKITSQPLRKADKVAGKLSKTAETYAQDWIKESIYGVKKSFSSKYTDKGNTMEDAAIEMAINWLDLPVTAKKNEQYFENDFFTGTPDLILEENEGEVLDIKCPFDAFTFPLFADELPEKNYFYQMQVYLHLTGKTKGRVVYVLMNTPEDIEPWKEKHDYNEVDPKYRIKVFPVVYDPSVIEFLESQVLKIRQYINGIMPQKQ